MIFLQKKSFKSKNKTKQKRNLFIFFEVYFCRKQFYIFTLIYDFVNNSDKKICINEEKYNKPSTKSDINHLCVEKICGLYKEKKERKKLREKYLI